MILPLKDWFIPFVQHIHEQSVSFSVSQEYLNLCFFTELGIPSERKVASGCRSSANLPRSQPYLPSLTDHTDAVFSRCFFPAIPLPFLTAYLPGWTTERHSLSHLTIYLPLWGMRKKDKQRKNHCWGIIKYRYVM